MTSSKTPEEERRKNRPHISSAIEKSVSQQISKTQVAGHSGGQRQLIKVNRKLDDSAKGKIALCKRWKQIWNLSASLNIAPEGLRESFHF